MEAVIANGLNEELTIHVASDDRLLPLEGGNFVADGLDIDLGFFLLPESRLLVGGVDFCSVQFPVVVGVCGAVGVEEDGGDGALVQDLEDSVEGGVIADALSDVAVEELASDDVPHGAIQG
jgi:hypothetical protein